MSRTTSTDYPFYTCEMFGRTPSDFLLLLTATIAEQSGLLALRLGSLFASVDASSVTLLTRAEKLQVEAELLRLRILRLVGTVINGDQADLRPLERQRQELLGQVDALVQQLITGSIAASSAYSGAVVESGTAHNFPSFP